ncbi:MAG TPA: threonine synthase [Lentisphaeria bacterium]|nr:MAG: threonine synthase [Lentisphaerae bacterium GWF2_38_69]HBM16384.1 threonine synthase [Lentisphaeria bacterium]
METKYICSECSKTHNISASLWRCDCGGLLDLLFEPKLTKNFISDKHQGLWRYKAAFPLEGDNNIISFDEGFTPLSEIIIDDRKILIKQDHLFPTASYKDRGASILISKAKELGVKEAVEDSSGNAGCSIAAYCAKADIKCNILVPSSTSKSKLFQIEAYGAKLDLVPGSRDDTAEAAYKHAEVKFYASHVWNPFFFHGTKTFAYEVAEQLDFKTPDSIVLPMGNGTIFIGAYIGFSELLNAGLISKMPRFIAVQSANCAPVYSKFKSLLPVSIKETLAEGIAIGKPARIKQLLKIVEDTHGDIITVSEGELIDSHKLINKMGYFIEPTSAAVTAGLRKFIKSVPSKEIIVSTFTGHGLKAAGKATYLTE